MGPNADKIASAARESGAPVPKAILEAPALEDSYQTRVLDAFWKLSTCRELGMGAPGPIRWDAVDNFARRHQFDADEIEYECFVLLIYELDDEFLTYQHAKMENDRAERKHGKAGDFRPKNAGVRSRRPRRRR
jgi:hypothetical protein